MSLAPEPGVMRTIDCDGHSDIICSICGSVVVASLDVTTDR
jgi:hypothetical protein